GVRDIEMVARRLRLEAGRAVGGDTVAEAAVDALEVAALAGLLRQLLVAPDTVDQYTHGVTSFHALPAIPRSPLPAQAGNPVLTGDHRGYWIVRLRER